MDFRKLFDFNKSSNSDEDDVCDVDDFSPEEIIDVIEPDEDDDEIEYDNDMIDIDDDDAFVETEASEDVSDPFSVLEDDVEDNDAEVYESYDENVNPVVDVKDINNEKLDEILNILRNGLETDKNEQRSTVNAILSDDDVAYVISTMLEYHDKYFSEYDLSHDIPPEFMWNIPKALCDLSKKLTDYGYSDQINPLFWFYMFCIDISEESYISLLRDIRGIMSKESYKELDEILGMQTDDEGEVVEAD